MERFLKKNIKINLLDKEFLIRLAEDGESMAQYGITYLFTVGMIMGKVSSVNEFLEDYIPYLQEILQQVEQDLVNVSNEGSTNLVYQLGPTLSKMLHKYYEALEDETDE